MAWPTTNDPKTEFATLRFTASEAASLDAAASLAGMTRSAFIRDAVRRVLTADARRKARLEREAAESVGSDG